MFRVSPRTISRLRPPPRGAGCGRLADSARGQAFEGVGYTLNLFSASSGKSESQPTKAYAAARTSMPFHFEFDPVNEILQGRFDGLVTDESLREYYQLARKHGNRLQPRGGITDFSALTAFEVSAETLRQLAHLASALPDPTRPWVLVAPSNHVFGLSRMFQAVAEATRPSLRVVRTLEEAYALLGVQAPHFEPLAEAAADGPAG